MVGQASHRFFICLGDGTAPIPWAPPDPEQKVRLDCVYFGRALGLARERLPGPELTFYLTWNLNELPGYGEHVVAVVLGDEDARIPSYVGRVGAVFKCYGSRPFVGHSPVLAPSRGTLLIALQGIRRWLRHLPDDLRLLARGPGAHRAARAAVRPIPLGYYNQLDLPLSTSPRGAPQCSSPVVLSATRVASGLRGAWRGNRPRSCARRCWMRSRHLAAIEHMIASRCV